MPIHNSRHNKVQENCIELMGRIGAEFINPREWMPICFKLLKRAQEFHPPRRNQHEQLHRQGHQAVRRPRLLSQQPQGPGLPYSRLLLRVHHFCRRDLLAMGISLTNSQIYISVLIIYQFIVTFNERLTGVQLV
jgi:hypothetical protein